MRKLPKTDAWRSYLHEDEAEEMAHLDAALAESKGTTNNLSVRRNVLLQRAFQRKLRAERRCE